jgi:pimeloyl-ACP methyl ester carboxylesterase
MHDIEFSLGNQCIAALDNQGSGPVILGLHGFLDNAESLRVLAPHFSNYRFIALDLPGHGYSSHRPRGMHYNQADYLQDIHALITSQQWDKVILIGHSMGGILASMYAGLFPEHVVGVISIDACGPLTMDEDTAQAQMREAILSRSKKRASALMPVDIEKAVKARCSISDIPAASARQILKRNITQDGKGNDVWGSDPLLRTKSILRLTESQAKSIMGSVLCPILFIAASNSFKKVDDVFAARQGWFKNARVERFVGGHHIHMENSDDVGAKIAQFVEQM